MKRTDRGGHQSATRNPYRRQPESRMVARQPAYRLRGNRRQRLRSVHVLPGRRCRAQRHQHTRGRRGPGCELGEWTHCLYQAGVRAARKLPLRHLPHSCSWRSRVANYQQVNDRFVREHAAFLVPGWSADLVLIRSAAGGPRAVPHQCRWIEEVSEDCWRQRLVVTRRKLRPRRSRRGENHERVEANEPWSIHIHEQGRVRGIRTSITAPGVDPPPAADRLQPNPSRRRRASAARPVRVTLGARCARIIPMQ